MIKNNASSAPTAKIVNETDKHWWVECSQDGCDNTQVQGKVRRWPIDPFNPAAGMTEELVPEAVPCWCAKH